LEEDQYTVFSSAGKKAHRMEGYDLKSNQKLPLDRLKKKKQNVLGKSVRKVSKPNLLGGGGLNQSFYNRLMSVGQQV